MIIKTGTLVTWILNSQRQIKLGQNMEMKRNRGRKERKKEGKKVSDTVNVKVME